MRCVINKSLDKYTYIVFPQTDIKMIITSFANVNEFEIRRSAVMPAIRNETGVEEDSSMNVLKLTQFIFYTLSGLSAVICSLIIIFTIFLNKSLRNKDFYLLAALAGTVYVYCILVYCTLQYCLNVLFICTL